MSIDLGDESRRFRLIGQDCQQPPKSKGDKDRDTPAFLINNATMDMGGKWGLKCDEVADFDCSLIGHNLEERGQNAKIFLLSFSYGGPPALPPF